MLGDIVGKARIVGLGEMTHGSRELIEAKNRAIKFLIESAGVTHIVLEANSGTTESLNAFVKSDRGDAHSSLGHTAYWSLAITENVEFVEWVRRYNAAAEPSGRISFHGCDVQSVLGVRQVLVALMPPLRAPASNECRAA